MFIVQVFEDGELFKSLELFLGEVLKWQATRGRDFAQLMLRSPRTEPFKSVEFYLEDGLKWSFSGDTGKETLHVHCSDLQGDRALQVSKLSYTLEMLLNWQTT